MKQVLIFCFFFLFIFLFAVNIIDCYKFYNRRKSTQYSLSKEESKEFKFFIRDYKKGKNKILLNKLDSIIIIPNAWMENASKVELNPIRKSKLKIDRFNLIIPINLKNYNQLPFSLKCVDEQGNKNTAFYVYEPLNSFIFSLHYLPKDSINIFIEEKGSEGWDNASLTDSFTYYQ